MLLTCYREPALRIRPPGGSGSKHEKEQRNHDARGCDASLATARFGKRLSPLFVLLSFALFGFCALCSLALQARFEFQPNMFFFGLAFEPLSFGFGLLQTIQARLDILVDLQIRFGPAIALCPYGRIHAFGHTSAPAKRALAIVLIQPT